MPPLALTTACIATFTSASIPVSNTGTSLIYTLITNMIILMICFSCKSSIIINYTPSLQCRNWYHCGDYFWWKWFLHLDCTFISSTSPFSLFQHNFNYFTRQTGLKKHQPRWVGSLGGPIQSLQKILLGVLLILSVLLFPNQLVLTKLIIIFVIDFYY